MQTYLSRNQASCLSSIDEVWRNQRAIGYPINTLKALVRKGYVETRIRNGEPVYKKLKPTTSLEIERARKEWALVPGNGVTQLEAGSFVFNTRTINTKNIAAMRRMYDTADDAIDAAIESSKNHEKERV